MTNDTTTDYSLEHSPDYVQGLVYAAVIGFVLVMIIFVILTIRKNCLKYEFVEGRFRVKQSYRDKQARKMQQLQELQRQAQLIKQTKPPDFTDHRV